MHSSAGARSTGAVVGGVGALSGEIASPGCRLAALCRADAGTWEFSAGGTCPLLISTHTV